MSDDKQEVDRAQDLVLRLDEQRGKEIESVRGRMEEFLRGQIEISHEVRQVAENQKVLKERFEEGVAKRLTGLDMKFDKFTVEWGRKLSDDENRDKRIVAVEGAAKSADDRAQKALDSSVFFVRAVAITICGSIVLVALIWGIKTILP